MSILLQEGVLDNRNAFCMYGAAVNGTIEEIGDNAYSVGEDAAVVLPNHNIAAVFDATIDPSRPTTPYAAQRAATSAVRAVIEYFDTHAQTDVRDAMVRADQAIRDEKGNGLCVGTITRIIGQSVQAATIGDAATLQFEAGDSSLTCLKPQQQTDTTHYLGVSGDGMLRRQDIPYDSRGLEPNSELYCLSDGVLRGRTRYDENIFEIAHGDWQRFNAAMRTYPDLQQDIREYIASQSWNGVVGERTNSLGEYEGPTAFIDPGAFMLESIDWELWIHVVQPYIHTLRLPAQQLTPASILRAIFENPIGKDSTHDHDDATAIMITPA